MGSVGAAWTARARFGSLEVMKRNNSLFYRRLKGFQPLHFTWQPWQWSAQPYRSEMLLGIEVEGDRLALDGGQSVLGGPRLGHLFVRPPGGRKPLPAD